MLFSQIGSTISDRVGRRPALIWGSASMSVVLACAMAASSQTGVDSYESLQVADNAAASKAGIAFLIMAHAVYAVSYAPLLGTYPAEVLSLQQRTTGIGLSSLVTNGSSELCAHVMDEIYKDEISKADGSLHQPVCHSDSARKGEIWWNSSMSTAQEANGPDRLVWV